MVARNIKNKGLIAFLLSLVILIGLLAYQNSRDFSMLKSAFDSEKLELEKELDGLIERYQNAISDNNEYSLKIEEQLNKTISLRDTVRELKTSNYKLLRFYKKRISILEAENNKLLHKLDSLHTLNQRLFNENDSVREVLTEKEELNSKLNYNNKILEKKIESAEVLDVSNIFFEAMKKRGSGKLTTTSRSSKTDAFSIKFDLMENKIIEKGNVPIHIQLINPENEVIYVKGRTKLKSGKKIIYTDTIDADYYNKQLSAMSLIEVDKDKMKEGFYKVKIYVNNIFTKESTIKLK